MREGVRWNRTGTGFAALAAVFLFGTQAAAQDTRSYVERQGYRPYQVTDGERAPLDLSSGNSLFTVNTASPTFNGGEISRMNNVETERSTDGEDAIVVTGTRRSFDITPHPDFERNIFADAGMRTNHNLENEGLGPFAYIRPEDREGWRGVDVEIIDIPGPISFEAQIKRGAGFEITYHFGGD